MIPTTYHCTNNTCNNIIVLNLFSNDCSELENNVRLEGPDNPLLAGGDYAITCVVTADVLPEVKWRDGEGNDIPYEEESGGGVYVDKEKITGRTTRLKLRFPSLLTSQGGTYSCLSIIIAPSSIQVGARDVIAKSELSTLQLNATFSYSHAVSLSVPPPVVRIVHQPERPQLFTTDSLDLICLSNVNLAVDVPVSVSMTWLGPSGTAVRNDSRVHVLGTEGAMLEFDSSIRFSSLRSTDSGSYTCSSAAVPSQTSRYIINSDVKSTATSVNAGKLTMQAVKYIRAPNKGGNKFCPLQRLRLTLSKRFIITAIVKVMFSDPYI